MMSLLDQVCSTIAQQHLVARGDQVIVGVSGGADSLTLLHCLRALRSELQIELHVAHLNHQLRGADSDADAEFVAWLAREWQLPTTVEARNVAAQARERHLSIEEAARTARYAFLAEVAQRAGARVIAVAHHADDQAETVLMHFLRGAGMAGLRGMDYQSTMDNLRIVRPLLDATRAEIEEYCEENSLTPRLDSSNLDTTFFRNRLRHEVLPYLETLNPNLRQILARTSRVIADDYDVLQAQVRTAYANVAREADRAIVFALEAWCALHPALQRGTLRAAVQQLRSDLRNLDWTHIENARRVALEKSTGAAATLPRGLMLTVGYDHFAIADAARSAPLPDLPLLHAERIPLPTHGQSALPDSAWVVETQITKRKPAPTDRWTAVFDAAKCQGKVYLRRRRAGDRFQPIGLRGHSQSVAEFMIDAKIPRAARDRLPLLVVDDHIVWVCGWRADERARVTEETREFWHVTLRKKGTH